MGSKKAAMAGVGGIVGECILMAIEAYTGRITLTKWLYIMLASACLAVILTFFIKKYVKKPGVTELAHPMDMRNR